MATCFGSSRILYLLLLAFVVLSCCEAKKKNKGRSPWTPWRCNGKGLLVRTRTLRGFRPCPGGGGGRCHRIQTQRKRAGNKCGAAGPCGTEPTANILGPASKASQVKVFSVGTGYTASSVASIGNELYVLCSNGPQYNITVFASNSGYAYKRSIDLTALNIVSSGGLIACVSCGYLYLTSNKALYRLDSKSGSINMQVSFEDYSNSYYDDVTDESNCNVAIGTSTPIIHEFTKDGVSIVNLTLAGVVSVNSVARVPPAYYFVSYGDSNGVGQYGLFDASGKLVASPSGITFSDPVGSVLENNGYVLVADISRARIAMLSSSLTYAKDIVEGLAINHMQLDVTTRRLYLTNQYMEYVYVYTI